MQTNSPAAGVESSHLRDTSHLWYRCACPCHRIAADANFQRAACAADRTANSPAPAAKSRRVDTGQIARQLFKGLTLIGLRIDRQRQPAAFQRQRNAIGNAAVIAV